MKPTLKPMTAFDHNGRRYGIAEHRDGDHTCHVPYHTMREGENLVGQKVVIVHGDGSFEMPVPSRYRELPARVGADVRDAWRSVLKKKPTISFERHVQIGKLLHDMRNDLLKLHLEVWNSHSSKHRKNATTALFRAHEKIDAARSELEDLMFADHRDQADIHVYYPR
jgi:hypothetical protein